MLWVLIWIALICLSFELHWQVKSMQFKWVPTTYTFIKKYRKKLEKSTWIVFWRLRNCLIFALIGVCAVIRLKMVCGYVGWPESSLFVHVYAFRQTDTPGRFCRHFAKGDNFCWQILHLHYLNLFNSGGYSTYSTGKGLFPGEQILSFKSRPQWERRQVFLCQLLPFPLRRMDKQSREVTCQKLFCLSQREQILSF